MLDNIREVTLVYPNHDDYDTERFVINTILEGDLTKRFGLTGLSVYTVYFVDCYTVMLSMDDFSQLEKVDQAIRELIAEAHSRKLLDSNSGSIYREILDNADVFTDAQTFYQDQAFTAESLQDFIENHSYFNASADLRLAQWEELAHLVNREVE